MESSEKQVLFLSNGYAEDLMAARVVAHLNKMSPEIKVKALPVVGEGRAYFPTRAELLDPRRMLPSGGFLLQSGKEIIADLKDGLLRLIWQQGKTLRRESENIDLVVGVGDFYLIILNMLFVHKPMFFIPTAKSDYICPHFFIEKWIMRHFCQLVAPRDEKTARSLRKDRIKAAFVGNLMMDCIDPLSGNNTRKLEIDESSRVIGILPGSREEAYLNLSKILRVVDYVNTAAKDKKLTFLMALASSLDLERIRESALKVGWELDIETEDIAHLSGNSGASIIAVKGRFGEVLRSSKIAIGLAGTANEQAVGMRVPTVAFTGYGPQTTPNRFKDQNNLLGESLYVAEGDEEEIASQIWDILNDPARMETMRRVGRERMGEPGGTKRVAELIGELLKRKEDIKVKDVHYRGEEMLDLSIVIASYNTKDLLENCLQSLFEHTKDIEFEVWVVDNNSSDGSIEMVKREFPQVKLIENKDNLGFAKANNQAIGRSNSRYVLLLNSDTTLVDNSLKLMISFLDERLAIGALGCSLIRPDGKLQSIGRGSILLGRNKPKAVNWVEGACLMLRREALEEVGYLDENFFFYSEDMDMCVRIRKGGWKVFSLPQAKVVHYGGGSSKNINSRLTIEGYKSGYYYCEKHYGEFVLKLYKGIALFDLELRMKYWGLVRRFSKGRREEAEKRLKTYEEVKKLTTT